MADIIEQLLKNVGLINNFAPIIYNVAIFLVTIIFTLVEDLLVGIAAGIGLN